MPTHQSVETFRRGAIDRSVGLGKLLQLLQLLETPNAQELTRRTQPILERSMRLVGQDLAEQHVLLGCMLVLGNLNDPATLLEEQIRVLLKVECWDNQQRESAAITWAIHRIDTEDISEKEASGLVPAFADFDIHASMRFGLKLIELRMMQEEIKRAAS